MLQKLTLPFGDGGVMDAVASAELYLGALALEDFQDELELELWASSEPCIPLCGSGRR
jgi:hypothetical protein